MNGLFHRLAARAQGVGRLLSPRLPSLFEPAGPAVETAPPLPLSTAGGTAGETAPVSDEVRLPRSADRPIVAPTPASAALPPLGGNDASIATGSPVPSPGYPGEALRPAGLAARPHHGARPVAPSPARVVRRAADPALGPPGANSGEASVPPARHARAAHVSAPSAETHRAAKSWPVPRLPPPPIPRGPSPAALAPSSPTMATATPITAATTPDWPRAGADALGRMVDRGPLTPAANVPTGRVAQPLVGQPLAAQPPVEITIGRVEIRFAPQSGSAPVAARRVGPPPLDVLLASERRR